MGLVLDNCWRINLGAGIPVYADNGNSYCDYSNQIGTILTGECFVPWHQMGSQHGIGWEGYDDPVMFKNAAGQFVHGLVEHDRSYNVASFWNYASNGSRWLPNYTGVRKVVRATRAYYADGTGNIPLAVGSKVWLSGCVRGKNNPDYISVSKVQKADGTVIEFQGGGFIDLLYGGSGLMPHNINLNG